MKSNLTGRILLVSVILILGSLVCAPAVQAQESSYPNYVDPFVNDFAGVLTSADAGSIQQMFKDLKNQSSIEAVVVTIHSIKDYNTNDSSITSFATNLFNHWGIGDAQKNNGVLILVAVNDRECQIALGTGYEIDMNAAMQQVIDQKMIPYFKNEDYSGGIVSGARGVIEKITGKVSLGSRLAEITTWISARLNFWTGLLGVALIVCLVAGVSCMRSGKTGWGWAFFAGVGAILLAILKGLWEILVALMEFSGSSGSRGYRSSGSRSSYGGSRSSYGGGRSSFGGGSSRGGGAHGKW